MPAAIERLTAVRSIAASSGRGRMAFAAPCYTALVPYQYIRQRRVGLAQARVADAGEASE